MSLSLHTLVIRTFASVEAKDLDGTMSLFAEDAVVIDPGRVGNWRGDP